MKKTNLWKRSISGIMAAGIVFLAACGGEGEGDAEKGTVKTDTSQTKFTVMGGMSALSGGYEDNAVLNQMQENAGINIEWITMSDSLAEQVNIRIGTDDLPDAFQAVGFSNYDLSN